MTRSPASPAESRARVYLHIGEPKTGTTYLQQLLWANKTDLAGRGVLVPGGGPQRIFRAVQDLRDVRKHPADPAAPWTGEWDRLAGEAVAWPGASVISHELLCAVDDQQAARAVESLAGAQVHVVITVRDVAGLLPAEWQESVKHRSTRGWDDWLDDVIDKESQVADRHLFWFWQVHDTLRILRSWSALLPDSQIHVVTLPRSDGLQAGGSSELWHRFASVLGLADDAIEVATVRSNSSLGLPEVELLRRLNSTLEPSVPSWFYMWNVKEPLAHGVLARRPHRGRLGLPAERTAWANAHAEQLIDGLSASAYDVVGNLDDLRPGAEDAVQSHPGDVTDRELLEVAVAATAALIERQYHRTAGPASTPFALGEALLAMTKASPATRRMLYRLSDRHRSIARLRSVLRDRIEQAREPA